MPSLSFIANWATLTYFTTNHGLENQDKSFKLGTQVPCCISLDTVSVFCKNLIFGILAIIFVHFGFFEVFPAFFRHIMKYRFETWCIYIVSGAIDRVRVSFQSGHVDVLYCQR